MTITYDHNKLINPLEEILINSTDGVISIFKPIYRVPLFISWIIGMILLITIGLLYTIVFYLPLLYARKKTKKEIGILLETIGELNDAEAVETHLAIEDLRKLLEKIVENGGSFFVFVPIIHEIKKTLSYVKKAETLLFQKAYPEYDAPLTKEQEKELSNIFTGWREDEKENMEKY